MKFEKLEEIDLRLIEDWLKKPFIKKYFGESTEWLAEMEINIDNSNWVSYFLVSINDEPLGFLQYYDTKKAPKGDWSSEPEGTVGIDFLIGEEKYLGKGYGNEIVNGIIGLIKSSKRNYKYIIADPDEKNIKSIKLLEKYGFIRKKNGLYKLTLE